MPTNQISQDLLPDTDDAIDLGSTAAAWAEGHFEDLYAQTTFGVGASSALLLMSSASTVWNESGADIDFRIEGDTDANLFYLDAGNDRIGIGTASPGKKLEILTGTSFGGGMINTTGTNGIAWQLASSGTVKAWLGLARSTNQFLTGAAANDLAFRTDDGTNGNIWFGVATTTIAMKIGGQSGDVSIYKTLNFQAGGELTIATGAITATATRHTVDTESDAASDDLDTINGGTAGDILFIRAADGARTVVIKHGTGNIQCGSDRSLDNANDIAQLFFDGTNWLLIAFADNGA